MSYNLYNNDLPASPYTYGDWREVYEELLAHLAQHGDDMPPWDAKSVFQTRSGEKMEIPYPNLAHYAAREQAEENATLGETTASSWHELLTELQRVPSNSQAKSPSMIWVEKRLEAAIEREKTRHRACG